MADNTQLYIDQFYEINGPCCAGCDFWRWHNSSVGECLRSAQVSARDRMQAIGMEGFTANIGAGHVFTKREHWCGDFMDDPHPL